MKMRSYRHTIAAGASVKIAAQGRFIRGMASEAPYQVRFDGGPLVQFQTGIAFESPEFWSEVELFNDQAASQTIEVVISDGFVDDNRLVGQVDISGGIRVAGNRAAVFGNTNIGTGFIELVPANVNRASITVQNLHTLDLLITGPTSGSSNDALVVPPGGVITLTTTIRLMARYSGVSGAIVRWLEETL